MRSGIARIGCACVASLVCQLSFAADIESVQKAAAEWAKVRAETARLQSDWEWQRQLLSSTNTALEERVLKLERQRNELKAKTASAESDMEDLRVGNEKLSAALAETEVHLQKVTEQLLKLRPLLPPRLSQALELPYRSLANPKLTGSERMLYVTTVLNRCAQFNKTITFGDELLTVPGGGDQQRLLNVVYWGLGQAYAVDRVSGKAYVGAPAGGEWTWTENAAVLAPLERAFAIQQEKSDPDFVELPVQIAHTASATQP